jgi:outer membrane lipoprotein carrier protein
MKKISVLNSIRLRAGAPATLTALIAFAFSFPAIARGQSATPTAANAAVLDKIQDHYQHTESFTAKFTEELTPIGGTKRTRGGQVWYKRPGMMRWDFDTPQKETVVADGHKLYDYQPDLNQVLEIPLDRAFKSSAPLTFLLGMGNLRRDFNAMLAPAQGSGHVLKVVLTPKSGGDHVTMELDSSDYDLKGAKVTDALGNTTSITFSSVQRNVQIAGSKFHFEVPPGADIVLAPGTPPPQHL